MIGFVRALTTIALALMLSLGSGLARDVDMSMGMLSSAAAADVSVPGGCDHGPGDESGGQMSTLDCAAFCSGGLYGLLPRSAGLDDAAPMGVEAGPVSPVAGRSGAPDPRPPRQS